MKTVTYTVLISSSRRSIVSPRTIPCFFFFNDTATTEIYTLSLHDALPIFGRGLFERGKPADRVEAEDLVEDVQVLRSEEHTSELQSHVNLVCRLLLEKKKKHTSTS